MQRRSSLTGKFSLLFAVAAIGALSARDAHAQAFDSVRKLGGKESVTGKISEITKTTVTVTQGGAGLKKPVPVNEIQAVIFAGEPADLSRARAKVLEGDFEGAKGDLAKVNAAEVNRAEAGVDVAYYKAYCDARLALAGAEDLAKARDALLSFAKANSNSFHYYEAAETLGDLSVAMKDYSKAPNYYNALVKAEWTDYQMRGSVLLGRAAQAEDKHQEAIAKFDAVLGMASDTPEGEKQMLAATLGKAISLAASDQVDEALKMIAVVIEKAKPEEIDLNARANNAMGACYVKANKPKEALRSYLKVHLLYHGSPEAHAEALANLTKLWGQIGKEERKQEALQILRERYPQSVWASRAGT
jgi:tetratricopeptide (TPR) repeat protein